MGLCFILDGSLFLSEKISSAIVLFCDGQHAGYTCSDMVVAGVLVLDHATQYMVLMDYFYVFCQIKRRLINAGS